MSFIEWYIIFSLSTGLFAWLDILYPTIKHARGLGIRNTFTSNVKLTALVYITISTIVAPFIIIPILVPHMNTKFRDSMSKVVFEDK
jgi:hypothetical protein